jgi:hypothetical protein
MTMLIKGTFSPLALSAGAWSPVVYTPKPERNGVKKGHSPILSEIIILWLIGGGGCWVVNILLTEMVYQIKLCGIPVFRCYAVKPYGIPVSDSVPSEKPKP